MGLSFGMLILHSELMPKSQKNKKIHDRITRYGYFKKWCPLKQTKTKNGHHFRRLTFKDIQLCCLAQNDSFTLKVLKLQFVTVKHDSASISNVECATYHIEAEPCLTETKCNFRTFGVNESFWAKQQSCIT